jgi:hypothetical protein
MRTSGGMWISVTFVNFDNKRFAASYPNDPQLERYVPDEWIGEFVHFANIYPEEIFPKTDKFWIVDNRYLLYELNERGRSADSSPVKPTVSS